MDELAKLFPMVNLDADLEFRSTSITANVSRDPRDVPFVLFRLTKPALTKAIVAKMRFFSTRPALYEELIAFAETFPQEQIIRPIVALGSEGNGTGDVCFPMIGLDEETDQRSIDFTWDREWSGFSQFLAVPEAPVKSENESLSDCHYSIKLENVARPEPVDLEQAYDWVWSGWLGKSELHDSLRKIKCKAGDRAVFLKRFDQASDSDQVITWANANGYRLAFPAEREAFTKANPDLQRQYWIVDLGTFANERDGRGVPLLCGNSTARRLDHQWFSKEWSADTRFLLIKKD